MTKKLWVSRFTGKSNMGLSLKLEHNNLIRMLKDMIWRKSHLSYQSHKQVVCIRRKGRMENQEIRTGTGQIN